MCQCYVLRFIYALFLQVHDGRKHEVRELVKNAGLEVSFDLVFRKILHFKKSWLNQPNKVGKLLEE